MSAEANNANAQSSSTDRIVYLQKGSIEEIGQDVRVTIDVIFKRSYGEIDSAEVQLPLEGRTIDVDVGQTAIQIAYLVLPHVEALETQQDPPIEMPSPREEVLPLPYFDAVIVDEAS
jgi:hypothetical protein